MGDASAAASPQPIQVLMVGVESIHIERQPPRAPVRPNQVCRRSAGPDLDPRCRPPGQPDIPVADALQAVLVRLGDEASAIEEDRLIDLAGRVQMAERVRRQCLITSGLPSTLPIVH